MQRNAAERARPAPGDMPRSGLVALRRDADPRPAEIETPDPVLAEGELPGLTDAWIVGPEPTEAADALAMDGETLEDRAAASAAMLQRLCEQQSEATSAPDALAEGDGSQPEWAQPEWSQADPAGPTPPRRPTFSTSAPRSADPIPTYAPPPSRPVAAVGAVGAVAEPLIESSYVAGGLNELRAQDARLWSADTNLPERPDPSQWAETDAAAPIDGAGAALATESGAWTEDLLARLRDEAQASAEPFRAMLRVALLEAVTAGVPDVDAPESAADEAVLVDGASADALLSPTEAAAWRAARAIVRGFLFGDASSGEPTDALALLASARDGLAAGGDVRIAAAALCRRVAGYGLYEPFEGTSFLAGSPKRMIVYAEADGFAHRPATDGERASVGLSSIDGAPMWSVALGMELNLYHESDGVLAWRRPRETVVDISRRQRRDFYVVADIELPPTLTVGRYQLKVVLRDETTGAEDEALIEIEVVADRSALAFGR